MEDAMITIIEKKRLRKEESVSNKTRKERTNAELICGKPERLSERAEIPCGNGEAGRKLKTRGEEVRAVALLK